MYFRFMSHSQVVSKKVQVSIWLKDETILSPFLSIGIQMMTIWLLQISNCWSLFQVTSTNCKQCEECFLANLTLSNFWMDLI